MMATIQMEMAVINLAKSKMDGTATSILMLILTASQLVETQRLLVMKTVMTVTKFQVMVVTQLATLS